ncbi:hypothetical protein [Thermoplasma sp. Kam2015]|uniref:hypothetical protein n=1 Tax=Thermoplasma sp. Kam2015 TaxID=2094122 RepID=UPI0012935DB9|nr:hypothetical protein [Thermoplasma sp. Kam2015]
MHSKNEELEEGQYSKYLAIRNDLDKELKEHWKTFEIEDMILKNIWDIKEISEQLNRIQNECLVNLSAGPSVFASAAILWGFKRHSLQIGHVIERRDPSLIKLGQNNISIFSFIDLTPYFFYVNLDYINKLILKAIAEGKTTSNKILDYLHVSLEESRKISLRIVQMRLTELRDHGLVKSSRVGRSSAYILSDDLTRIIGLKSLLSTQKI